MAELADALDLKSSCSDTVRVRFPPAALKTMELLDKYRPVLYYIKVSTLV